MLTPPIYASITARGTISIPAPMRRRLHLDQPGAQVAITLRPDNVMELRPCLPTPSDAAPRWEEAIAASNPPIHIPTDEEIDEWLARTSPQSGS
ncbi:MAG: type II toxin-antitoxin system PrlF family antitoxin [Propionibacteriaceae bacterium]|jgi:bifunctional DNA-binding transcriptional regulator/antitoxin component of YhaV-PrlF toxin-antitoxin module|nr:type II toxin-antitoxin system PrlF family antitoxin [Propionibacteriaceae bacterium]